MSVKLAQHVRFVLQDRSDLLPLQMGHHEANAAFEIRNGSAPKKRFGLACGNRVDVFSYRSGMHPKILCAG